MNYPGGCRLKIALPPKVAMDTGGRDTIHFRPRGVVDALLGEKFSEGHKTMISTSESDLQDIFSPMRINPMIGDSMNTPREIEAAAWKFFKEVISGMEKRPAKFKSDKDMAAAAGVLETTFNEYKSGAKGHKQPSFITIYKLAHVIRGEKPCSLDTENLGFSRWQEAIKKDRHNLIDKLISLILADSDIEPLAASLQVYHQRLFSPLEATSENP
ncbi:MAG: hypothetical protein ABSG90_11795 [Dehalococcoidia bacterium]|jgi:transcriptional regulator with XRE-family HTH domain